MNRIQKNAILGAIVLVAALALIGRGEPTRPIPRRIPRRRPTRRR